MTDEEQAWIIGKPAEFMADCIRAAARNKHLPDFDMVRHIQCCGNNLSCFTGTGKRACCDPLKFKILVCHPACDCCNIIATLPGQLPACIAPGTYFFGFAMPEQKYIHSRTLLSVNIRFMVAGTRIRSADHVLVSGDLLLIFTSWTITRP